MTELAIKATEALELDYSGVDILKDENGVFYVNEVNSSPGLNTPNIDLFSNMLYYYI